jgi:hypothetical protein
MKKFIINENTAKEMTRIIQRYIKKYGNITINELLTKLNTDCLILN